MMGWLGCAGPEVPPEPRFDAVLIEADAWVAGTDADPLAADRPDDATCPDSGVYVEGGSIEVDTGICTYAWLEQPLLSDLIVGDTVEIVFWHSVLASDPPSEGHLALTVDDVLLYERRIPIPSDSAAYTEEVAVSFAARPGATVGLHLHNHGQNTWNLLKVERRGDGSQ